MPRHSGFTLLETMIALAIVSILTMVAVPLYLDYEVRAKISEGFNLAQPVKTRVTMYYITNGSWPASNAAAALDAPSSYKTANVDSISVAAGAGGAAITITYSIAALGANNTIVLTPRASAGGQIAWSCTQGTVNNKFRPASCRS